jgi:hypothetical protein
VNPIPFAASITWGLLTAFGLWLLTIPLSLGEMGGPINWAIAYVIVSGLMLAIAAFTARAKGTASGMVCGILFSAPIAGACYFISHGDATILREHGGQLKFAAIAVVALSLLVMSGVAQLRNTPHPNAGANEKNF